MEMSEHIGELSEALSKAQGEMSGAKRDAVNPFFKSKYADLSAVWDDCRKPLSDNGLAIIQTTDIDEEAVVIVTTLSHKSGQWVRGKLRMKPTKQDPQGIGSCISYARRYALAAIVGVYQVDDDGNEASLPAPSKKEMAQAVYDIARSKSFNEDHAEELLKKISESTTFEKLKTSFAEAYNYGKKFNNTSFINKCILSKEDIKGRLELEQAEAVLQAAEANQ